MHQNKKMRNFREISIFIIFGICLCSFISNSDALGIKSKKKVCVIGAGASGLMSAMQLSKYPNEFDVAVFETDSDIAGTWRYVESADVNEYNLPVHTSIYAYLRTNIPKTILAFPNYREIHAENRSCVSHQTIFSYLSNFTERFNLRPKIKFNHLVDKITPIDGNDQKWKLEAKRVDHNNETYQTTCNAVMICNGHYSVPNMPKIPGIETFPGSVIHSHAYRRPEGYAGKTVVVLGSGSSGLDIAFELSGYANTVYLSHNHEKLSRLPANVIQVAGAVAAKGNTFILKDGTNITADDFIACTGYIFSFNFLDKSSGIEVTRKHITPLYKYIINIERPTMAFIGATLNVLLFNMFYIQTQWFVALLRGKFQLPSKDVMLKENDFRLQQKSSQYFPPKYQWEYEDELVREGGLEPAPQFYKDAYEKWHDFQDANLVDFKEADLYIKDDGEIEIVKPHRH